MKRFLKQILLFCVIFFLADKLAWGLLVTAPNRECDKRLEMVINGEMNKDLIVLGSSRGAGNILAGQLEQETGLSAYNLSYQGASVAFHEFILNSVIKNNKTPKTVLLTIDVPSFLGPSSTLIFRNYALFPLTNYNVINSELIDRGVNHSLSKFFFLSRLDNKTHFSFKNKKAPRINPLDSYGSMPLIKERKDSLVYQDHKSAYKFPVIVEEKLKAFQNIQALCKANNIKLYYVIPPNFSSFNTPFYKGFSSYVKKEANILVYDTLNPVYKDQTYFYDQNHLYNNGAKIFTSEVSRFINKKSTKNTSINP